MALPRGLAGRAQRFSGALLARIALRYKGAGYIYGGNASSPGNWDCSSFVSYVLHRAGLAIPGGKWGGPGMPPSAHGPVVTDYAAWTGATAIGQPQAGDLCIWDGSGPDGHIGIAISSTEMISALNPSIGTRVTPIQGTGPAGAPLVYRRVNGVAGGGVITAPGGGQHAAARPPGLVIGVIAGLYLGAAALAAGLMALAAAGVTRMMRRA